MQTIAAFAQQALAAAGQAASAVGHAVVVGAETAGHYALQAGRAVIGSGGGQAAGQAAGAGSNILKALRVGTSVVSALSTFQQGQQQAAALEQQANSEDMQARQEFIQSQEQANSIQLAYNRVVEQQLVTASGSGIDVGSGSVTQARQDAQTEADRQLTIDRNGVAMNAALRQSRASYLRGAASLTSETAGLTAAGKLGQGVYDAAKVG